MPPKTLSKSVGLAIALVVVACSVTEASIGDAPSAGASGVIVPAGGSSSGGAAGAYDVIPTPISGGPLGLSGAGAGGV
jgi:hypothetical protein